MNEAVTLGFDQVSQSWTTGCSGPSVAQVPPLDGTLLIDEAALGAAADDFGNLRQQLPLAVLEPASTQDVVSMVSFAREQGIKIGPRGQGISTYGEAQVPGGLVIKLNTLRQAPVLGPDWVEVSPGLAWRDVLLATLEPGLRPPVLTQTLYLSVGGTLSVGGIDGGSYRYGAQVDNVLEMQVVTGEGRLVTCSETEERELFEAVLAGRGQCGIVVRARLRLIPAETHTLFFQLLYRDLDTLLDDHRMLIADGRFDRTSTYVMPSGKGRWTYYLQGARNFTPPSLPDQVSLLAGMQHLRGFEKVSTLSYFEYADRGGRHKEQLRNQGRLNLPHPFFNAILPASAIKEYAAEVFGSLDSSLIEPDFPVEFYGLNTALSARPLFRLPDEPVAFLIDVLTTYSDPRVAEQMIARNRQFFERARELGGKLYGTNSVNLDREEWQQHFEPHWQKFAQAKRRFDPDNILAPGPGIF